MERFKKPEENLPLVHHCTAGRDRTGVGSMIMLVALGVSFETVLEDYLLSNHTLESYYDQIYEKTKFLFSEEEHLRFRNAFPVRREYLEAALNSILRTYDDFETYMLNEYGITKTIQKEIQDFCLE